MANVTTGSNTDTFKYYVTYTSGGKLIEDELHTSGSEFTDLNNTEQRTRTFYPTTEKNIDENSSFTLTVEDLGTGTKFTSGTINIPTSKVLSNEPEKFVEDLISPTTNPFLPDVVADNVITVVEAFDALDNPVSLDLSACEEENLIETASDLEISVPDGVDVDTDRLNLIDVYSLTLESEVFYPLTITFEFDLGNYEFITGGYFSDG